MESGVSSFQIMFGLERYLAGVPYELPRECEGAQVFFTRMEAVDREVADVLNRRHREEASRVNEGRRAPEPFQVKDGCGFCVLRGVGRSWIPGGWALVK